MMISPESYRKQQEGKSLKELVKERNRLLSNMQKYERENILHKNDKPTDFVVHPSPGTIYLVSNDYLIQITELIRDKMHKVNCGEEEM